MARSIVGNVRFKKIEDGKFDPNIFAAEVEQAYLVDNRAGFTQKKTFAPSTIGYGHGNCARYWYMAFTGTEFADDTDAQGKANMLNGTYVHERIQKIVQNIPNNRVKELEREMKNEDPPIRGFSDLIVDWNGKEVIGEIKSAKDEVYSIRQAQMKASGNHQLQLLIYMDIANAEQGFFYYENKNDNSFLIIPISMTDSNRKLVDDTYDWLRKAYKAYQDETIPNRAFTKSQSACKYCPVKKTCWAKDAPEGEVIIEAMVPPK
jgi:CRISPR/Cas system-associated exonuclease Cas4 (RecB family)